MRKITLQFKEKKREFVDKLENYLEIKKRKSGQFLHET